MTFDKNFAFRLVQPKFEPDRILSTSACIFLQHNPFSRFFILTVFPPPIPNSNFNRFLRLDLGLTEHREKWIQSDGEKKTGTTYVALVQADRDSGAFLRHHDG